jgi:hypothetical protein
MDWIDLRSQLPNLRSYYFIADGKDIALAKFNAESMQWKFLWHYSTFKPTHMLAIKLPPLPDQPSAMREGENDAK